MHRYPLYVQLLALISSSYQVQMGPPFWIFHHIHMNAHSTYLANFEFNEKWQGIKFSKNWKFLWLLVTTPISHSMARNLHFSTEFPIFFYQKIQLEISYGMTKLDFKNRLIWHVWWAIRWLHFPPCTWVNFPHMMFKC